MKKNRIIFLHEALIFDNSNGQKILIAEKILGAELSIFDHLKFEKLKSYQNESS